MKRFAALCCLLLLGFPSSSATLRWTSQGDALSMDPHGQTEVFTDSIIALSYEYLVTRGKDYSIVPALAASWSNPSPRQWIFNLRREVKFHDGSPFTARDVVFSLQRARESNTVYRVFGAQVGIPRAVDDHTVEFNLGAPNPAMLDTLAVLFIMSRDWCERHGVSKARDPVQKEESYATRNAMGTGPYRLVSYEPGVATRFLKNPQWWGIREGLYEGNVETIDYRPIPNAGTRIAALVAGQVDFVLDPPVQDLPRLREIPALKVWQGQEMRVTMLLLDQRRDELLYSDVKGRNPFRDRRVRQALYQAIDVEALRTQVMRGLASPTAIALPDPAKAGVSAALERRPAFDPATARRLLADAGYPGGFGFTLHCPNDRWINDERLCVAIAAMWARVGLKVAVDAQPKALYIPRALKRDVSAALLAWGGNSSDPNFILKPVMRTPNEAGAGSFNFGGASNARLDELIDAIEVEVDKPRRTALIDSAVRLMQEEVHVIPLHRQMIPWASRAGVTVVPMPNNWLIPMWVHMR